MTTASIIFLLSLVTAGILLGRRIWQLRTGKIMIEASHEHTNWTEISVEAIRNRLIELLKIGRHYGILLLLKLWIKLSYFLKRCDRFVHKQLMRLLHKNTIEGTPSSFIRKMKDHKEEVAQKVQEGE